MDIWQVFLVYGAFIAWFLSENKIRSFFWIAVGASAFVMTTAWNRFDLPEAYFFAGVVDTFVCLLLYFIACYKWEMIIFKLFKFSIIISLFMVMLSTTTVSSYVESLGILSLASIHTTYIICLEVINWAALFVIGGTGVADYIGSKGYGIGIHTRFYLLSLIRPLCDQRADAKWTEKW